MRHYNLLLKGASVPSTGRGELGVLASILALAVLARLVAMHVLHEPIVSDAAAYLEMARTLAGPGPMRDTYGNAAFYSPGYPFALAGAYALGVTGLAAAQAINLFLGLISTLLMYLVTRRAGGRPFAALVAAAAYAVLIPAVAGTAFVQRENLSVPLLLLFILCVIELARTRRPNSVAAITGMVYGAGLLAGASIILTAAAAIVAMLWRKPDLRAAATAAATFVAGAALVVTPWLAHVDHELGRPVLTTNGPFNLYVGNNPAADGRFVSLRDTPIGAAWHGLRAQEGELGATDQLGRLAVAHIRAHPVETVALSLKKLVLFWLPDLPDNADTDHGAAINALRWLDVVQYLLLAGLGLVAILRWRTRSQGERLVIITLGAFWAIHAAAYVMPRYRLPALPLLAVLATGVITPASRRPAEPRPLAAEA